MKIKQVSLKNYRSIGTDGIVFEPQSGLNVIVGENNVGKSSVFSAISLAFEKALGDESFRSSDSPWGSATRPELSLSLELDQSDRANLVDLLWGSAKVERAKAGTPVSEKVLTELHQIHQSISVELIPAPIQGFTCKIQIGSYECRGNIMQTGNGSNKNCRDILALANGQPLGKVLKEIAGANLESLVTSALSTIVSSKLNLFADVRARPEGSLGQEGAGNSDSLSGDNTAYYLLGLMTGGPSERLRYRQVSDRFEGIFPELKFNIVRIGGETPTLVFSKGGHQFDIPQSQVGTGVVEILTIIANLEGNAEHIFVIEEPELHLHPHSQRALRSLIAESAEQNQIFILTHSPFFVACDNLESIYRMWLSGDTTNLSIFPQDLNTKERSAYIELLRETDSRELLFSRAVLLVEGETEAAFLKTAGPRVALDTDRVSVSIFSVDGQDNYMPYIKLLESLSIPYICQRDIGPGGSPPEYQKHFRFIDAEFEEYMAAQGHGELIDSAKSTIGAHSKVRVGRYLGSKIDPNNIPEKFKNILSEIIVRATQTTE